MPLAAADAPAGWVTGFWSAAACQPVSWPSTVAPARPTCRWPTWSGVAGQRCRVEESFQASKGLCGLDEHQVRGWRSWYRWATLAMLADAFLAVAAATERAQHPPPPGMIALSCNEIAHLFAALVIRPVGDVPHRLGWSSWRRRHQARARTCHSDGKPPGSREHRTAAHAHRGGLTSRPDHGHHPEPLTTLIAHPPTLSLSGQN